MTVKIIALGIAIILPWPAFAFADLSFSEDPSTYHSPVSQRIGNIPISRGIAFEAQSLQSLEGLFDQEMPQSVAPRDYLRLIFSQFLASTEGARFNLNFHGPYDPKKLNIYFLNARDIANYAPGTGICSSIPRRLLIICNASNIRNFTNEFINRDDYLKVALISRNDDGSLRFVEKHEMDKDTRSTIDAKLTIGFVSWIVAHELGHIVRHKSLSTDAFFFDSTASSQLEAEADEFAAKLILASDVAREDALLSIDEFVERSFQNAIRAGSASLANPNAGYLAVGYKIKIDSRKPQEILVYRGVQIYRNVANIHPTRDTTGFYNSVYANISLQYSAWRLFTPNFVEKWIDK